MFPGRWPNNPDSMWNSGWSMPSTTPHQTFVPHAQFCGGDPSYQQCQAQTQAQIQALQQKNALLNQQLYNQSMTHINHLQPLIPHQQTPQPSTIPTPPIHPTPPTPQSQPEPPTVTSPSPPPTPPAFNPEEMINQMKMTFKEGLAAAVEIANERHIPNNPLNPLHQLHITTATFHLLPTNLITPLSNHVVLALFIVQKNPPSTTNMLCRHRGIPDVAHVRDYSP